MDDYRFRLIEIEGEFEDEDFGDEEFEGEEEDEGDYDDREREEHLFPGRVTLPIDLDIFNTGEPEEDDDFDDYDDEDEEDGEDYDEEEELMPVARMLHMDPIEDDDYEDEEDYGEEDDGEEDYEEEEVEELFPVVMTSPRVSSSIFHGRALQGATVINNGVLNDSEPCEGKPGSQESCGGEIHGSICPICFEAWTGSGEHQIWHEVPVAAL